MSSCVFCQKQDDMRDVRIYATCDIAEGKPCGPCTEYLELEAQIEETRKTLEQQLGKRHEIRQNINRLHDRMLVRVPREMTAYIFELAASIETSGEQAVLLREGELYAPLSLGKVCGAWRDIAWAMPQLWNFMSARIRTVKDLPSRLDVAKQWLERSGDYLPLSIHFRVNETYDVDNWDLEEFVPFMELLNLYAHRWKDLCGFCPPFLFEHLSAELQGAPILKKLQLSANNLSDAQMIFDLGCKRLPQPRCVRLDTTLDRYINIDWSQVTLFDTNCPWGISFLALLPHLPKLKDLRIYDMIGEIDAQHNPVAHFNLQSLYINCSSPYADEDHLCDLLDFFIFPSLQRLTINLMQSIQLLDTVVSFLQRSSCKLVSLSLSYSPPNSRQSFLNLLECADSIEDLEVSTKYPTDRPIVLEVLLYRIRYHDRPSPSGAFPLPELQGLKYVTSDSSNIPWDLLLPIFDPNWSANRPQWRRLSVVHHPELTLPESQVFLHRGFDERLIEGLITLVDTGIELFLPRKIYKDDLLDLLKPQPHICDFPRRLCPMRHDDEMDSM